MPIRTLVHSQISRSRIQAARTPMAPSSTASGISSELRKPRGRGPSAGTGPGASRRGNRGTSRESVISCHDLFVSVSDIGTVALPLRRRAGRGTPRAAPATRGAAAAPRDPCAPPAAAHPQPTHRPRPGALCRAPSREGAPPERAEAAVSRSMWGAVGSTPYRQMTLGRAEISRRCAHPDRRQAAGDGGPTCDLDRRPDTAGRYAPRRTRTAPERWPPRPNTQPPADARC